MDIRLNGNAQSVLVPKSIMKNSANNTQTLNGGGVNGADETVVMIPKKPIQKVIPSRNTELMSSSSSSSTKHASNDILSTVTANGDCIGYVKPSSPMKSINGCSNNGGGGVSGVGIGILTNNNKFTTTTGGIKSPVGNGTNKLVTGKAHR